MVVAIVIMRIPVNDERGKLPKKQAQKQLKEFSTKSPVSIHEAFCTQNSWRAFKNFPKTNIPVDEEAGN